jgi:hypothetical protein
MNARRMGVLTGWYPWLLSRWKLGSSFLRFRDYYWVWWHFLVVSALFHSSYGKGMVLTVDRMAS